MNFRTTPVTIKEAKREADRGKRKSLACSIKAWEYRVAVDPTHKSTTETCALCRRYYDCGHCDGCPLQERGEKCGGRWSEWKGWRCIKNRTAALRMLNLLRACADRRPIAMDEVIDFRKRKGLSDD